MRKFEFFNTIRALRSFADSVANGSNRPMRHPSSTRGTGAHDLLRTLLGSMSIDQIGPVLCVSAEPAFFGNARSTSTLREARCGPRSTSGSRASCGAAVCWVAEMKARAERKIGVI